MIALLCRVLPASDQERWPKQKWSQDQALSRTLSEPRGCRDFVKVEFSYAAAATNSPNLVVTSKVLSRVPNTITTVTLNADGHPTHVGEATNSPDVRWTEYQYDLNGNLKKLIPPKGDLYVVRFEYRRYTQQQTLEGTYEGRVTCIRHPGGTWEFFGYDAESGELEWSLEGGTTASRLIQYQYAELRSLQQLACARPSEVERDYVDDLVERFSLAAKMNEAWLREPLHRELAALVRYYGSIGWAEAIREDLSGETWYVLNVRDQIEALLRAPELLKVKVGFPIDLLNLIEHADALLRTVKEVQVEYADTHLEDREKRHSLQDWWWWLDKQAA